MDDRDDENGVGDAGTSDAGTDDDGGAGEREPTGAGLVDLLDRDRDDEGRTDLDEWARLVPDGYGVVDPIHGDPADDALFWLFQGYGTGTCAATSVGMIVADLAGVPAGSNQEVVERALALGVIRYDPANPAWQSWGGWSGMTAAGTEILMESYGVATSVYAGATVGDLAAYLDAGHSVLVTLDSSEAWYGADDDGLVGGVRADHTVQVTGVDLDDGLVYLNDPALAHGAGVAVSLDVFADAWADGGATMITTDAPLEGGWSEPSATGAVVAPPPADASVLVEHPAAEEQPTVDPVPAEAPVPAPADAGGTVFLPFTLVWRGAAWIEPVAATSD